MNAINLKHMKEIYSLVYWKEMICYSGKFIPQIRSYSNNTGGLGFKLPDVCYANSISFQGLWP